MAMKGRDGWRDGEMVTNKPKHGRSFAFEATVVPISSDVHTSVACAPALGNIRTTVLEHYDHCNFGVCFHQLLLYSLLFFWFHTIAISLATSLQLITCAHLHRFGVIFRR